MNNKRIQSSECEGFEHIRGECANTLKKNKSLNVTWSDGDYDCSNDDESKFLDFAFKFDNACAVKIEISYGVPSGVSSGVSTLNYESSDDEDLIEEAVIQAFKLLHTKWADSKKVRTESLCHLFFAAYYLFSRFLIFILYLSMVFL